MRALHWIREIILPSRPAPGVRYNRPVLGVTALEARRVLNADPVINDQSFAVYEGAPDDTLIGVVTASDADPGDGLIFAITADDSGGLFKIDPHSGELRVHNGLSPSDAGTYSLTISVTDPDGATDSATITIEVLAIDLVLNDAPVINEQQFLIEAGAAADSEVGTVTAFDPDLGDTLTYSISGTEFSIDAATGLIKVADAAAVLSPGKYVLTVTVEDASNLTDTAQITILINGPPTDLALDNLSVAENSPGAIVGQVTVTDPNFNPPATLDDTFTFEITGDALNRFEIMSGQLKLKDGVSLDYETDSTINLTIKVTDQNQQSYTESFDITVDNVNDPPTAINLDNQTVDEHTLGAVIGQITVTDEDDSTFTYEIQSETTPGNFVTDTRFEIDNTGQLKLIDTESLDHETAASMTLRIIATDSGNESVQNDFVIVIQDVNEVPVDIALTSSTVAENAPGAVIGTVTVTDEDDPGEPFGQHTLTVQEDYGSGYVTSTRFEIVGGTLQLIAGVSLDHETAAQVTVRIVADDGSTNPAFYKDFVIDVTDVNESPTDITLSNTSVAENSPGAIIGTVTVTDEDDPGDPFGQHTLTVEEDYGGGFVTSTRFEIVGGNLQLIAGVSLDHETAAQVTVRIVADDSSTSPAFHKDFVIDVTDTNDPPTDITLSNGTVDENSPGATIGTVTVTDEDSSGDPFGQHTFTVYDDSSGVFAISDKFEIVGGILRLQAGVSLDYEAGAINVRIVADDGSGTPYSEDFAITIVDQNDPPTDIVLGNTSVDENATGAVVGTVTVTDEDSNGNPFGQHTFTVEEDYGSGFVTSTRFEIVAGQLRLRPGVSLDHESEAQVTVRIVADDGSTPFQKDFVIEIVDVNEAPTDIALSNTSVDENSAGAVIGSVVVTDPDASNEPFGQHVFTVEEEIGGFYVASTRFEVVGGVLQLKAGVSLDYEEAATINIRIIAADGTLPAFSKDFVIDVVNHNDLPSDIALDNDSVNENSPGAVIGNVVVVDQDAISNPFGQHVMTVQEDYGSGYVTSTRFEIVGGQLRLKPGVSLDHELADQINIRIVADDGSLPPFSKDFTIHVQDVNEAPTDIDLGSNSVPENTAGAVVGTVTVTDPDNPSEPFGQHTYTVQEDYGGGFVTSTRFEIVGGQLRLIAGQSLNYELEPQVTLRIYADDGTLPTFYKDFVVTVIDQNDPPTATDNEYSVDANQVLTGNVITDDTGLGVDADEDQNSLAVALLNGSIAPGQTFTTALGAKVTVQADGSFVYDPTDSLTLKILTILDSIQDSFTYEISDGQGGTSNVATVTILVQGVNDAPTVSPTADDNGREDTAIEYSFADLLAQIGYFDPDNTATSATLIVSNIQGGSFVMIGGTGGDGTTFRFTPALNSHAPITFDYQVLDAGGEYSNTGQFTISVRPVNDAPILVINDQLVLEDGQLTIPLSSLFTDVESAANAATYTVQANSSSYVHVSFDYAAGTVTFTLTPNFNGIVTLTIRATDTGDGSDGVPDQDPLSAEASFTLYVLPVDDAPVVTDEILNLDEDTFLSMPGGGLLGYVTDVDSDPLLNEYFGPSGIDPNSFALVTMPQHAQFFAWGTDGSFTYVPTADYFGQDTIQFLVYDLEGNASNIATLVLQIAPINDAPTFVIDTTITINPVLPQAEPFVSWSPGPFEYDQTVTWHVQSADPSILPTPSVEPNPQAPGEMLLVFSPAPFLNATTTITITATDSQGLSTVQVITVELIAGQIPPSNLEFEARPTIVFPEIRDIGPLIDLTVRASAPLISFIDSGGSGGEATSSGERLIEVYLLDPTTGEVLGDAQFTLPGQSLDRLNELFRSLPDDKYRIILKLEDGSRRRVMDVVVRDQQPYDPGDTQDERLIPNQKADEVLPNGAPSPAAVEPNAPAAVEQSEPSAPEQAVPQDTPALPLTPPGNNEFDASSTTPQAAVVPMWLLLASTATQNRQRKERTAVSQALADVGRRPWLLYRRQQRPR